MTKKFAAFVYLLASLACDGNAHRGASSPQSPTFAPTPDPSSSPTQTGSTPAPTSTALPTACKGLADGSACSDGTPCHAGATCLAGACQGATPMPGPCSTSLAAIPLKGSAYYQYTVPVIIGGAGPFDLILDTGSPSVAVTGADCTNCDSRSPTYTPGAGVTTSGAQTSIVYGCGTGFQGEGLTGWSGQELTDSVALGTTAATAQQSAPVLLARITDGDPTGTVIPMFVCLDNGKTNSGQGIIGFTSGDYHGLQSYIDAAKLTSFTLQTCDVGGRLWLNGYDPNYVTAPPQFTPLVSTNVYGVNLQDLQIGGKSVVTSPSGFGQTVIDSGTTRLTLPSAPFNALLHALTTDAHFATLFGAGFLTGSACGTSNPPMTGAQLDAILPKLSLVFPGIAGAAPFTLDLPASESYLTPDTATGASAMSFCPGIEQEVGADFASETLLGNVLTHSHLTIYDIQNMRLGFAPQAHCDTAAP